MSDITIVTAFFDIGRGNWTQEKGFLPYHKRTIDDYFQNFERLSKLDNEMVVVTSPDLIERVKAIRCDKKTHVIPFDLKNRMTHTLKKIEDIQKNNQYINMINANQRINPEYWNAEYVLINWLKPHFCYIACETLSLKSDVVAWIDFGYCRQDSFLNGLKKWKYDFDKKKIHFWSLRDIPKEINDDLLKSIISNNEVYITGPNIVASRDSWEDLYFDGLINIGFKELLDKKKLSDDDQTLWTLYASRYPERCEIHKIQNNEWFRIFKDYAQ